MIRALALVLLLAGCAPSVGAGDPYLNSEEGPLSAFCAAHPHHGTCP